MKKRHRTTWTFRIDGAEVTVTFERLRRDLPTEIEIRFGDESVTLPLDNYRITTHGDVALDTLDNLGGQK